MRQDQGIKTHHYPPLVGEASDDSPAILSCGNSDISTLFVSLAERHPEGKDAEYLRWHSLDHRPEQMRLPSIRSSLRVVSTPECRAARLATSSALERVDHAMIYFFSKADGLQSFGQLSSALRDAGRSPFILPPVARGVYQVEERLANSEAKVGADVLPWLPTLGVFLLVEEGDLSKPANNTSVAALLGDGVAGAWQGGSVATEYSSVASSQVISILFLTQDPLAVTEALAPKLRERWQSNALRPLLAAPMQTLVPYEWTRHLP